MVAGGDAAALAARPRVASSRPACCFVGVLDKRNNRRPARPGFSACRWRARLLPCLSDSASQCHPTVHGESDASPVGGCAAPCALRREHSSIRPILFVVWACSSFRVKSSPDFAWHKVRESFLHREVSNLFEWMASDPNE